MKKKTWIGLLLSFLLLCSCNDGVEIKQDYDFNLSSWYLQKQVEMGETVEIRFYLTREGDYDKARYELGYIQMDGKGEVFDSEGTHLINREVIPLDAVPDLDTTNPKKQVFTLFYRSTSTKRSELKFFLRDNFNQEREMNVTFDVQSGSSEQ
ncbi:TraQ conjugal transfer family protein [Bacteroides reticulotermitis]|uniref:TraQ conjugal transfer family protein n=1 Tax=Bacteroides reticulotermitis TaxID=1133319 RepID=UPI003A8BCE3F